MLKLLAFPIIAVVGIIGQTGGGSGSSSVDPWVTILQWGPAGVVLVLLASGQLRFGREIKSSEELYKEEKAARVKAEQERDTVNAKAASEFIPLLTQATNLLSDFRPKNPDRAVATALAAIAEKLDEIEKK